MSARKEVYRWGVIGYGIEADSIARAISDTLDADVYAVFLPHEKTLAHDYPYLHAAPQVYTQFEDLVMDEDIDIIYIASPIAERALHIKAALSCRKAVVYLPTLFESYDTMQELYTLAKEKETLLLEGMVPRFLPPIHRLIEVIRQKALGDIMSVQADASTFIPFDPEHPMFHSLEGGVLRKEGIYPILLAVQLLGQPTRINTHIQVGPTDTEEQYVSMFYYEKGVHALLSASCALHGTCEAHVIGTKSRAHIHAPFYGQTTVSLFTENRRSGLMKFNYPSNAYYYLIAEAQQCHAEGRYESTHWSHAHMQCMMRTLQQMKQKACFYQET